MRPAYDLTTRAFLQEESPNTRFVPSGLAVHDAGKVTNVHQLTDPYRSESSPRPSGDEALAALTLLADLRDWLADVEPDLITAARDAGVTWEALAPVLRVGDRRAAQRRHARLTWAFDRRDADHTDHAGQDVPQDVQDVPHGVPAGAAIPGPAGRDWDDSDLCRWREDGEWSLQGPDGVIEVEGFGFLGTIVARNVRGAQAAAAAAVEELTGRTVTGWGPDVSSRSIHGGFSWYPCTQTS
ncbi:hypothetical protein ABT120_28615 [Nonomuraea angiospora]|uniref:hypothetical protein n=1 Tax=Nonomuraea angiospora TaxID=46172 RepID=UPI0033274687